MAQACGIAPPGQALGIKEEVLAQLLALAPEDERAKVEALVEWFYREREEDITPRIEGIAMP